MIEILGLKLRENKNIETVGPGPKLHAQYADDIWAAIKFLQNSFNELMKTFQKYTEFSGLKVNYQKPKILRIGPIKYRDDKLDFPWPLQWERQIKVTMNCY